MKFTVYGHPETAGSKRGFGRGRIADDNPKARSWQAAVRSAAIEAGCICFDGPVYLELTFYLHRPKAHWGTGRKAETIKASAPRRHTKRPDVLKLARAVEDALTRVCWLDDSQICEESLSKRYAAYSEPERVDIELTLIDDVVSDPLEGQLSIEDMVVADG